jgi:hypothetical protein
MVKQTRERVELYVARTPPGLPLPIRVDPALVNDAAPTEAELRMLVGELRNGRAAGTTGMKAEHIKGWLADIKWEEREDDRGEGLGDQWRLFVTLLQAVWTTGSVPT